MDTSPQYNFARFLGVSFVLFCLFLPLWRFVSPLYTRLLASLSHPFLPRLAVGVEGHRTAFFSQAKGTTIFIVDPRGVTEANLDRAPAIAFDTSQAHRNVPLLLALFFATPGIFRQKYWGHLSIILGVLFLWHTGYVTFVLYRLAAQVASAVAPAVEGTLRLRTDLPYEMFFRLFIPQLLPFLLWMGVLHFRQTSPVQTSTTLPLVSGRNQPCPCGSGRKYKRCCGATVGTAM